jgi:rSAM/selenodomain-associated transferase 2
MKLSVIVPVLHEARLIETALTRLTRQLPVAEVIVVDGGSTDDTLALAQQVDGVTVLQGPRGRAQQMNVGAAHAKGDVLLFLHADTTLPPDAHACIQAALADPGVAGGAFRIRTTAEPPPWWAFALHAADLRSRYSGLPYGDQGIFCRAAVFRDVGGFAELRLMEDLAFSQALRQRGRLVVVRSQVTVSGRRFVAQPVRSFLAMNTFPVLFRLGVSTHTLERLYGNPR